MKSLPLFSILFVLGMLAACSTSPDGTTQSNVKDTATSPEVTAEAPPITENAPAPENQDSENAYNNAEVGFSITKPSEWHYMSRELVASTRNSVRLDDAELEKKLTEHRKNRGNAPLVAFARHLEPYPNMNPNVSVTATTVPMEGLPLKNVLNMTTAMIKKAHNDMVFVDEVQDREVGGLTTAYAKMKYTVALTDGQKFPVMGRIWLAQRGKTMFTIGMTGTQEGPDVAEDAFKEILESIKFEK